MNQYWYGSDTRSGTQIDREHMVDDYLHANWFDLVMLRKFCLRCLKVQIVCFEKDGRWQVDGAKRRWDGNERGTVQS